MAATPGEERGVRSPERFLSGVLWSWAGIAVQLFLGIIVSPYLIRKLGTERYGIWALVFSMTSYYGYLDLGFRSAVVRFSAHFRARGENDKVNELVNSVLFCFFTASLVLVLVTLFLWQRAGDFFRISPALRSEFAWLVLIVGISIAVSLNANVFAGLAEGLQRFDVLNRIRILIFTVRGAGWFALLASGFGLVALGAWNLLTHVVLIALYLLLLRRFFPEMRFSRRLISLPMLKQTAGYGLHTFVATLGGQSLDQTPSLLIGYFRSAAEVGYFSFPLRLLQYASYAITNVGVVAMPQSASLAASGQFGRIARLGICANRYCLSLFMPLGLFVTLYGRELFTVWVTPEFAARSAPLLPALAVGFGLAQAAQFCSGSILFGIARQKEYARALVGEAIASFILLALVIPRHGLIGAAVVTAVLMSFTRGLLAPWFLCRHLDFPFLEYMRGILWRPAATAAPVWIVLFLLKQRVLTESTWSHVIAAAAATCLLYMPAAYFTCLENHHRGVFVDWARRHLAGRESSGRG